MQQGGGGSLHQQSNPLREENITGKVWQQVLILFLYLELKSC